MVRERSTDERVLPAPPEAAATDDVGAARALPQMGGVGTARVLPHMDVLEAVRLLPHTIGGCKGMSALGRGVSALGRGV